MDVKSRSLTIIPLEKILANPIKNSRIGTKSVTAISDIKVVTENVENY